MLTANLSHRRLNRMPPEPIINVLARSLLLRQVCLRGSYMPTFSQLRNYADISLSPYIVVYQRQFLPTPIFPNIVTVRL